MKVGTKTQSTVQPDKFSVNALGEDTYELSLCENVVETEHVIEMDRENLVEKLYGYNLTLEVHKIKSYEEELKRYAVEKLKQNKNITIYNENTKSGIIAFNYKNIFAQDLAIYLNKYNICVRAGNHCAKILKNELKVKNTCRISFYFYNTKEEIDKLVKVLENDNIMNELF